MPHRSLGICTNYTAEAQPVLCFLSRSALGPAPAYLVAQSRRPPKKVDAEAEAQRGHLQRPVGSSFVTHLSNFIVTRRCDSDLNFSSLLQSRVQNGTVQNQSQVQCEGQSVPAFLTRECTEKIFTL